MSMYNGQKRHLLYVGAGIILGIGIFFVARHYSKKKGEENVLLQKLNIVRQLKGTVPAGAGKGNAPSVGRTVRNYD